MSGTILKTGANISKSADRIVVNATSGDIDLTSAKSIVQSSDSEIVHGSYKQPDGTEDETILVEKVEGPEEVEAGKMYTYKATGFSRKPIGGELKLVKWAYQIDGGKIIDFEKPGVVIGNIVKKQVNMSANLADNETIRVFAYMQAPTEAVSVESRIAVALIRVTTNAGKFLFSLRPTEEHPSEKITAKDLYDKGLQWFCPEADDYLEFVEKDPDLETFSELKHFTWSQIVAFAEVDRWSISYRSGGGGDWKSAASGGDGYVLITVGGFPYWADAIGQIPFSVDTYRENLENGYSKDKAIRETLKTGQKYGDGSIFGGSSDFSNSYDNHIILRTCLWATNRYDVIHTTQMGKWATRDIYKTRTTAHPPTSLQQFLTAQQVQLYFN